MAYFINTNKHRGYLNNLNVNIRGRKSLVVPEILRGFSTLKPGESIILKSKFTNNFKYISETEESLQKDDLEEQKRKLWIDLLHSSENQMDIIDKLKSRLKIFELLIALIALVSIVLSQIDYELDYYPNFYEYNTPDNYNGLCYRLFFSVSSLLLSK